MNSSDAFFLPDNLTAFLGFTGSSELFLRLSQGDRVVWILFIYSVAFPEMVAFPHRPLAGYGGYGGGGGGYGGGGYGGGGYSGGDYGGRLAPQNLRSIKTMCAKMRRQWYTCWPDVYLHSMEKIQALSWDSQLWPIMNVTSLCGISSFSPSLSKAMVAVVVGTRCEVGISEFHDAVTRVIDHLLFPQRWTRPRIWERRKRRRQVQGALPPSASHRLLFTLIDFASIVSLILKLFWLSDWKQILPASGSVQLSCFDLEQSQSCRERESTTETVAQKASDTEIWLFRTGLAFHGPNGYWMITLILAIWCHP